MLVRWHGHDFKQRAAMTRHRAGNDDLPCCRIDGEYFQIFYRHTVGTHATSHTYTLGDATARATARAADGARLAFRMLLTVAPRAAVEAVTLHSAGEALTFRDARNAHVIADRKNIRADFISNCCLLLLTASPRQSEFANRRVSLSLSYVLRTALPTFFALRVPKPTCTAAYLSLPSFVFTCVTTTESVERMVPACARAILRENAGHFFFFCENEFH